MERQIIEVKTKAQVREFLDLPSKIYQNDNHWVRPLDKDIEAVFDPEQNKFFKTGVCSRWLMYDASGAPIARIASFISRKYKQKQPTGGIGFFECIEDEAAAHQLFDHCRDWLKERGMEAMDGPINFGERDRFWGLLTDRHFEPLYYMNYNPPYYKDFFEHYGFQVYFYQECYGMKVAMDFQSKFFDRHRAIAQNKHIRAQHLVKKNWKKFAKDFAYIYNKAWASHGEGKTLDEKTTIQLFRSMRPMMDERINWFAYEDDEPVACWINLPDLNYYFKHLNGKFGLFQKLYLLWLKATQPNPKFVGIIFGVLPKWQKKGMDAYLIVEGAKHITRYSQFKEYEMQWIGDFNPKMANIAKSLGATVTRRLATYRYLFDRNKPFERHPILT